MKERDTGFEALANTSFWLEHTVGTETLFLGHSAFDRGDGELEISGRSLAYWLGLRGGRIWISVREMDDPGGDPPIFFSIGDTPSGWCSARRFVSAMERSGVSDLKTRPIRIGESGSPDSFVIA